MLVNNLYKHILQWKDHETPYTDKEFTREEVVAFEDAIMQHGAELRLVREEVGTRTIYEVVRFYGQWKKYVCQFLQVTKITNRFVV